MLDRSRSGRDGSEVIARIVLVARTEQLTLLSAGVAFYWFISLVPLVMVALGIALTLGGEQLATRVTEAASEFLTPSAQELLANTVLDGRGRRSATALGSLGLLWGASRALRGLDRAFSAVYGTTRSKSILGTVRDTTIAFVAITIGLTAVAALETVIRFAPYLRVAYLSDALVVLGLAVTFLPMYVLFPDKPVTVREVLPGTMFSALGWFVLTRTFSRYASFAGEYTVYGALGVVFFVLIWMYASATLLIFGAICNAVLAGREADRQLQSPGPRHVPTGAMTDDATGADDGSVDDDGVTAGGDVSPGTPDAGATARTRDRADDPEALREEIERLRDRVDSFESSVESRTVEKSSLETELKRYVRRRVRRSHARDWGPYLVLLYGTLMTVAAFYYLEGGWAILAMFVVWTSTLGVYVLMVLFGAGLSLLDLPGRLRDRVGEWRS